ncbi:uroporphyrinogen-III synthase [Sphingomonas sp. RS2018]
MTAGIGVLRPEPGSAATAARVRAAGLMPVCVPLFAVEAVAWDVPDAGDYDSLVLTSANAVRHAGPGLAALAALPVRAVGAATASAAEQAGLHVETIGTGGVESLPRGGRLLHLAGRDHMALPGTTTIVVYDSVAIPADVTKLVGTVTLVHSARAARRLRALVEEPASIRLVAISDAVAVAAGRGWADIAVAPVPDDATLIDMARSIA